MCRLLLFASLREKYGVKEVEINWSGGGLKEFFLEASKKLGSEFLSEVFEGEKPRDDRIILVDGRNIKDIKGKVRVKPESVVAVFPPMAGG